MEKWISPSAAMDLVYDDPARIGSEGDFGFAILWANAADGSPHSATDLARAKLQPRRPSKEDVAKAEGDWPVTAHAHRLVLAPGVADIGPRDLFEAFDRSARDGINLLAVVQTLRFSPALPRHDMMHAACTYAALCLRPKGLSSLVVQHMPSDARSARQPHCHIYTLATAHRLSGFGETHPMFTEAPADMHRSFEADWHRFRDALARCGA